MLSRLRSFLSSENTGTGIPEDRFTALRSRRRLARSWIDQQCRAMDQATINRAAELRDGILGALDALCASKLVTEPELHHMRGIVLRKFEEGRQRRLIAHQEAQRAHLEAAHVDVQVIEDPERFFFSSTVKVIEKQQFRNGAAHER